MTPLGDRVWECRFHSPALDRETRYTVVMPETPSPQPGHTPLVLLLHGAGRHCRTLIDAPKARRQLLSAPFATVMPNGAGGWWVDSPARAASRCQALVGDVLKDAESRFAIGGSPERRGLTGWSMGGFGCTLYAESHRHEFSALAPMIGLLDFPNPILPRHQNHSVPAVLGPEPERFNPMLRARELEGLDILLITGDGAFDVQMNRNFHAKLEQLRIAHEYIVLPGQAHTFACVEQCLEQVVRFFREVFAKGNGQ